MKWKEYRKFFGLNLVPNEPNIYPVNTSYADKY